MKSATAIAVMARADAYAAAAADVIEAARRMSRWYEAADGPTRLNDIKMEALLEERVADLRNALERYDINLTSFSDDISMLRSARGTDGLL